VDQNVKVDPELLGQLRRMVALAAATKVVVATPYASERALEIAKEYEDYIIRGGL
jgi:hypothetical protein